jgi:chromosome segregation ATPase
MTEPGPTDSKGIEADLARLAGQREELSARLAAIEKELRSLKASDPGALSKAARLTSEQDLSKQSLAVLDRKIEQRRKELADRKQSENQSALEMAMQDYKLRLEDVSKYIAALDSSLAALRLASSRIAALGESRAFDEMGAVIEKWLKRSG